MAGDDKEKMKTNRNETEKFIIRSLGELHSIIASSDLKNRIAHRLYLQPQSFGWFQIFRVVGGIVILLLATSSGLAWAAEASLPGDMLYPVKATFESIEEAVVKEPVQKVQVHLKRSNKRVEEIKTSVEEQKSEETIQTLTDAYTTELTKTTEAVAEVAETKKTTDATVHETVEKHVEVLEKVQEVVPTESQVAVETALDSSKKVLEITKSEEEKTGEVESSSTARPTVPTITLPTITITVPPLPTITMPQKPDVPHPGRREELPITIKKDVKIDIQL